MQQNSRVTKFVCAEHNPQCHAHVQAQPSFDDAANHRGPQAGLHFGNGATSNIISNYCELVQEI
jgi:hypothetical protein